MTTPYADILGRILRSSLADDAGIVISETNYVVCLCYFNYPIRSRTVLFEGYGAHHFTHWRSKVRVSPCETSKWPLVSITEFCNANMSR